MADQPTCHLLSFEKNKDLKLFIEDKYEIILLKSNRTANKVKAEKYGLSESTISTISIKYNT